jgi:hypothetical protein
LDGSLRCRFDDHSLAHPMPFGGRPPQQGSTDIPTLYNMLPTYLAQPHAFKPHHSFKEYIEHEQTPTGWWHNFPKYAVGLLKAWYGEQARQDNGWGFHWLPRIVGDHSQLPMTLAIRDGVIRGMFVIGQNPAVGGHNAAMVQRGLAAAGGGRHRDRQRHRPGAADGCGASARPHRERDCRAQAAAPSARRGKRDRGHRRGVPAAPPAIAGRQPFGREAARPFPLRQAAMTQIDIDPVLAALDRALADRPDRLHDDLVEAVRRAAALRDQLIAQRHRGGAAGERLARVNAALSLIVGGEYPLVGVRLERIEQARKALAS